MADRRTWTIEQDEVLKRLRGTLNIKKWSEISKILESDYRIVGRNGKQCRQRYNNHLMENINFTELSLQQEEKLFKLHNRIGNKWASISKEFEARTDNQIKNHFHSKLRKGVRKLNKEIILYFKKTNKGSYKLNIVYKIVEASDLRFGLKSCLDEENLQFFNDFKNCLLEYAGGKVQQKSQISLLSKKEQIVTLISKVEAFQNHLRCNRWALSREKPSKKGSKAKTLKESRENSQTENSHSSQVSRSEEMAQQGQESNQIQEQASFQFIDQMEKETNSSDQTRNKEQQRESIDQAKYEEAAEKKIDEKMTGIQKRQILQSGKIIAQKQAIINSLVQESEFHLGMFGNRICFNQFESLREFEDSYINQSEISQMMRRFDGASEMDARLFE